MLRYELAPFARTLAVAAGVLLSANTGSAAVVGSGDYKSLAAGAASVSIRDWDADGDFEAIYFLWPKPGVMTVFYFDLDGDGDIDVVIIQPPGPCKSLPKFTPSTPW